MKKFGEPYQAKPVTLVTTVFIPELAGYWTESLDVLKVCLNSVFENTGPPFDLLVFDNGSCREVRSYLLDLHAEGKIQYLLMAHDNVAKLGCFNMVFPGSPGDFIGFFDSDVYFHPGWLEASIKVFETFDRVGTVTARPGRHPVVRDGQMTATYAYADNGEGDLIVERGDLIPKEILDEHFASLGYEDGYPEMDHEDVKITRGGVSVYAHGSHFQFLTKRDVAKEVLPVPLGDAPLGSDRRWDAGVNELGYLSLSLDRPLVRHIGNSLANEPATVGGTQGTQVAPSQGSATSAAARPRKKLTTIVRRVLLKIHNWLTRVLYS